MGDPRAKRPRIDITDMNISHQSDDLLEVIHQSNDKDIADEPEILFCDKCEFETITLSYYEEHVKSYHSNDIQCKECKFSARNKSVLKDHMLATHKGIPCNNCHNRFSDLTILRKHVIDTPDCRANILK